MLKGLLWPRPPFFFWYDNDKDSKDAFLQHATQMSTSYTNDMLHAFCLKLKAE